MEINQREIGDCTKEVVIMVQFMTGKENLTKPSHLKWPVDVFDEINLCGKQLITRETTPT